MNEWINAVFTVEWLLGLSMGLAFPKLMRNVVTERLAAKIRPDSDTSGSSD